MTDAEVFSATVLLILCIEAIANRWAIARAVARSEKAIHLATLAYRKANREK